MKELNKLEKLQQKSTGIIFIKSYPVLNNIKSFTPTDRGLIELVMSYQDNDQPFKMSYAKICEVLVIKMQTLKNVVLKLKDLGILVTDHKSNFNGINGGSSTALAINIDKLTSMLEVALEYPQSTNEPEVIKEPIKQQEPIKVSNDSKKEAMRIKFESKMKYSKDAPISPADFHNLTGDYFMNKFSVKDIHKFMGLKSNDFESFWNRVQELKEEVIDKTYSTIEK
jgi:hypothetical protein